MRSATSPRSTLESFRYRIEPLWAAALGIHFVVFGRAIVPVLIHLVGRGGQVETVEWAIYMALLFVYAPLVVIVAWVLPRRASPDAASWVRLAIVLLAIVELVRYAISSDWLFILSAMMAAIVTVVALGYAGQSNGRSRSGGLPKMIPLLLVSAFAWMCAGSLVSWGDALQWIASSPRTAIIVVVVIGLTSFALRENPDPSPRAQRLRWPDFIALAALIVFSFRTFPMVEFYHWGFYVGPIEQIRQGGRLLWDTPSQYGFLSILIPAAFPGNAWLSFWFFQSVAFAFVGATMYFALRRLGSRWIGPVFAFVVTFTTLFFRPRDETLILPAQMTPSGGPVRFLWAFVLLAFIAAFFFRPPERQRARDFVLGGTAIWVASILWSAEGSIYCTAIWFLSFAVFTAQRAAAWRETGILAGAVRRRVAQFIAVPLVALSLTVVIVALVYLVFLHVMPDWRSYIEYVLLYSRGGFGALPVDPSGSVWFLLLLFFVITTVAALSLSRDARDPRLVPLAGLWGCAWSVESYFVGRSHPVNALSLLPILLLAVAITVRVLRTDRAHRWHRLVVVALVPAFAMPVAITLGHANFPSEVSEAQLPLSRLTEQLPVMDASLFALLHDAGARPSDSYVVIADGRLMLPAWPMSGDAGRVTSKLSWLPKPYEIIGSLGPERRQVYFERDAQHFPEPGWLIHSKRDTIPHYSDHLVQIETVRREERRFENNDWIASWMVTVTQHPK
jgi:hypothetical protein